LGKVQTANRGKSQVWHTPAARAAAAVAAAAAAAAAVQLLGYGCISTGTVQLYGCTVGPTDAVRGTHQKHAIKIYQLTDSDSATHTVMTNSS
jgi:hypothetical protein